MSSSTSTSSSNSLVSESTNVAATPNKIKGLFEVAKTSLGAATVKIIGEILSDPSLFVFGEWLDLKSIQDLSSTQHKPHLELLKLFAYGTYGDYKANNKLPSLTSAQLKKLKQLTIVEHAAKEKILHYKTLMDAVDISELRDLEDLIIDCIYQGLLQGKLDQRQNALEVHSVMGRDLKPSEVSDMDQLLSTWIADSEQLVKALDTKMEQANVSLERKKKEAQDVENEKKTVLDSMSQKIKSRAADSVHSGDSVSQRLSSMFDTRMSDSRATRMPKRSEHRV
eukprot:TRINITY_DN71_c2_g3_i1.p1 TRINITY_DN71_c2_g3~~TRINITY_DN71_c2_g3_i1.p1  ORF type:complete len:281 (-),score=43.57 TRINITY_DN71_c2_g3_i1:348-1190(-)